MFYKDEIKDIVKLKYIIGGFLCTMLMHGCSENKPSVQSPFSHLDTVKTKKTETEEKKDDGTSVKSPFSNLDKNK